MEGLDRDDDNRTFRVNFTADGAAKMQNRVTEKLKEFLGGYTDDTLVAYVIVLLRNGRDKEQARKDLSVFLSDDTDAFVSWLWDHLSTHLHLYVPPQEASSEELAETKSVSGQKIGRSNSPELDLEPERETSVKESKRRRNREWKGLARDVTDPPPFQSSEIEDIHVEKKNHQNNTRVKRHHSPQPSVHTKRTRHDERQHPKREAPPHPSVDAPRRLLQFAVRDAVGTTRKPTPILKRLRSIVSTSTYPSSLDDEPQRTRPVPRLSSAVTTAFKAAAEAAEDVSKPRVSSSANVFDRLGNTSTKPSITMEEADYQAFDKMAVSTDSNYHPKNDYIDSASDNEEDTSSYGGGGGGGGGGHNKDEDSLMVQYSVAKNNNEIPRKQTEVPTSRGIVNISVNVNTWKPQHYTPEPKEFKPKESKNVEEIDKPLNEKETADMQTDLQKTSLPSNVPSSYSTGRPLEDADSRTIFVNNVHFGATKDTLSRHFNKFGEVLKVVMVTDATSGQPTGSTYIEFMRKEAAEHALSLNGTSFMSRILKVVRKSLAYLEAGSNIMTWPRGVARGSSSYGRFGRGSSFGRGMVTPAFRGGRLAVKAGPRSLQWKRGAATIEGITSPTTSGNGVGSPTTRSLTYVRKDSKVDANVTTA